MKGVLLRLTPAQQAEVSVALAGLGIRTGPGSPPSTCTLTPLGTAMHMACADLGFRFLVEATLAGCGMRTGPGLLPIFPSSFTALRML